MLCFSKGYILKTSPKESFTEGANLSKVKDIFSKMENLLSISSLVYKDKILAGKTWLIMYPQFNNCTQGQMSF